MPKDALDFLRFILKAAGNKWKSELNIKDKKLAEIVNCDIKTIQRKRNSLKKYMENDGKAVIDIKPFRSETRRHIGHSYSLNIFHGIENGIKNFIDSEENYIQSIFHFISNAETNKLSDINLQNNKFKQIFSYIQKELDALADKPVIIETFAVLMQRASTPSKE